MVKLLFLWKFRIQYLLPYTFTHPKPQLLATKGDDFKKCTVEKSNIAFSQQTNILKKDNMFKTLINASELGALINQPNVVIIDCRFSLADTESGRNDYLESHISTAQYAHLDDDLSGEIIKGITGRHPFPTIPKITDLCSQWGIDEDTQVIAYDQGHGGIAARLWFMLKWLGHEKVAVLNGGWKYWQIVNGATDSIIPTFASKKFVPNPNQQLLVNVQFMEQHVGDAAFLYVDSRAAKRYRGEEEPIDPIAGHIPSAISVPFAENLGEDGLFLSKAILTKRFQTILANQPIEKTIFYCGSGVTACHNLLAVHHIGKTSALLFPGSWSEWIVDENREVVAS